MEYIPYAVLVFGLFLYMLFSCRYQVIVFVVDPHLFNAEPDCLILFFF
jgi:hypothetical protein